MRLIFLYYSRIRAQGSVTAHHDNHWVAACMSEVHRLGRVYPGGWCIPRVCRTVYTQGV